MAEDRRGPKHQSELMRVSESDASSLFNSLPPDMRDEMRLVYENAKAEQRAEIARSYVNHIITYARKTGVPRQEAEAYVRSDMELEFEERERLAHEQREAAFWQSEEQEIRQRQG